MTLDDWEEMLNVSRDAPETPHRGAATTVDATAPVGAGENGHRASGGPEAAARHHPVATELLDTPGALLTRTHLRELGLERRAVDAVFRALPVVALPGYSRPMIRADQYVELVERLTYDDDRVRPPAAIMSRRPLGA
jgi:hypothetical protein